MAARCSPAVLLAVLCAACWLPSSSPPLSPASLRGLQGAQPAVAAAYGLERHRGKVALVTGAGSGVGWELATSLAVAGLRVVAVSRRKAQVPRGLLRVMRH